MADRDFKTVLFASCAGATLTGWVAFVVLFAITWPMSTDLDQKNVARIQNPAASIELSEVPRLAGLGLAGPSSVGTSPAKPFSTIAPRFTRLRLSKAQGRGLFSGHGQPNARVVLLREGRTVADTRVDNKGAWQIATPITSLAGDHTFSLEQRNTHRAGFTVGESIELTVPEGFHQTIDFTSSRNPIDYRVVAADGDDIGSASSRRFDQFFREGAGNSRNDDRANQTNRAAREVVKGNDVLEPAWNWLRDANRSYNQEIVPRIKRGGGFARSDENAQSPEAVRDEDDRTERLEPRRQFGENREPSDGLGIVSGVTDWLQAARRGYNSEIVPRLSGKVPTVIVARPRDEPATNETEAERLRREEHARVTNANAIRQAEQERLEAERRRREAAQRRKEAEAEAARIADEARRVAEARRREQAEEQRKIEAERQRALQRREQTQQRLAEEEAARRAELAAERRRAAELAVERQRAEEAERESRRLAQLALERERAREERRREAAAAEERRREAAAAEERRREAAAAEERARRAREQRLADQERRERQARLAAEAEAERKQRIQEQRRQRLARATPPKEENSFSRNEESREPSAVVPKPALDRSRRRDTQIQINPIRREQAETSDKRQKQQRYVQRDTVIEFKNTSDTQTAEPKAKRSRYRELLRPSAQRSRQVTQRKRRRRVRNYRRRLARSHCHTKAGRRITPPGTYVVMPGDSLWKISRRHYRLGRLYRRIHRANRKKIRIPRLIYPCQRFLIPRRS